MPISLEMPEKGTSILEDELYRKRSKHLLVQWLISGDRRNLPAELKPYIASRPDEAKDLFDRFRIRSRKRTKGKKHLFSN